MRRATIPLAAIWPSTGTRWSSARSLRTSSATGELGEESDNSVSSAGAAYVYVRSGATSSHQAYLKASNAGSRGISLACTVAIDGDTVVVGASDEERAAPPASEPLDNSARSARGLPFSYAAALPGATRPISKPPMRRERRSVLAIRWPSTGTRWSSARMVKTAAPPAARADIPRPGQRGPPTSTCAAAPPGASQAYLKASNAAEGGGWEWESGDEFGYSVAVNGDTVVVGAHLLRTAAPPRRPQERQFGPAMRGQPVCLPAQRCHLESTGLSQSLQYRSARRLRLFRGRRRGHGGGRRDW